ARSGEPGDAAGGVSPATGCTRGGGSRGLRAGPVSVALHGRTGHHNLGAVGAGRTPGRGERVREGGRRGGRHRGGAGGAGVGGRRRGDGPRPMSPWPWCCPCSSTPWRQPNMRGAATRCWPTRSGPWSPCWSSSSGPWQASSGRRGEIPRPGADRTGRRWLAGRLPGSLRAGRVGGGRDMGTPAEQYRPKTWADVAGQDAAVRAIRTVLERGWGGRAWWLVGPSGTGKTTLAKLIAAEGASDFTTEEHEAGSLTPAKVRELERQYQV